MTTPLWKLSAIELRDRIAHREISARQATESVLTRIAEVNPRINALASVNSDLAMQSAQAADEAQSRGEALGPMHGVPVTIKVNVDVEGQATTDGVAALKDNVASSDSRWSNLCVMPARSSSDATTRQPFRCVGSAITLSTAARSTPSTLP